MFSSLVRIYTRTLNEVSHELSNYGMMRINSTNVYGGI